MGDEEQTKLCTNCQRDIPAANFTIHSVHCTRNIAVCPKCKEPVPVTDMKTHLAHVSCKQCGEKMQACDMASHQSDACAHTTVACPHCTLQLGRALMADHELYCGARTERCADCGELVMVKYRRLHEESNHGFLKLDDEPGPLPSWNIPATRPSSSSTSQKPTVSSASSNQSTKKPMGIRLPADNENIRTKAKAEVNPSNFQWQGSQSEDFRESAGGSNFRMDNLNSGGGHLPAKRTNDMPQVNSSVNDFDISNSHKELNKQPLSRPSTSKGAIKKYQAPQPPNGGKKQKDFKSKSPPNSNEDPRINYNVKNPIPFSHIRDVPAYSALLREQKQQRQREEQTAYNLEQGLPPVLNPAQKLEKLRKMSALQNMDFDNPARNKVKQKKERNEEVKTGFAFTPMSPEEMDKRLHRRNTQTEEFDHRNGLPHNRIKNSRQSSEHHYESVDYSPWTNAHGSAAEGSSPGAATPQPVDRFMEIKNDLRVLRKELKECSSPLEVRKSPNTGEGVPVVTKQPQPVFKGSNRGGGTRGENLQLNLPVHNLGNVGRDQNTRNKQWNLPRNQVGPQNAENKRPNKVAANFVMLPCEFCSIMVPSDQLVDHELGHQDQDTPSPAANNAFLDYFLNDFRTLKDDNARVENARADNPRTEVIRNHKAKADNARVDNARVFNPQLDITRVHNPKIDDARVDNEWVNMGIPRVDDLWVDNVRVDNARVENPRVHNHVDDPVDNAWVNVVRPSVVRSPIVPEDLGMDNGDLNDVMLPCEFCHVMISATDFVTHETGCNPLATSILPPPKDNRQNQRNVNAVDDHAAPPNTPDGHPAPRAKNVNRHPRHAARVPPNDNDQRRIERLKQRLDNDRVSPQEIVENSPEEAVGPYDFDEVRLPCEFCMSLIPASNLMHHQEICYAD